MRHMEEVDMSKLDSALAQVRKLYGDGSIMAYGNDNPIVECEVISTGSISLDQALGIGGIPKRRITEIYGPEMGGKTTLSLHIIAEEQKQKGRCVFVDVEHALDPSYAGDIGVDMESLLISQPDDAEQSLDIVEKMVSANEITLVVVDSVAAMVPKAELEGDYGQSHMGLQARLMSQAMRKLTGVVSKSNAAVVFINQIREKIGVVFGNPEVTSGGRALKFFSSVRIDIRNVGKVKIDDDVIGNNVKCKVVKNKLASPFKIANFDIRFGEGIDKVGELINIALQYNFVEKSGNWYVIGDDKVQGFEAMRHLLLAENNGLRAKLEGELLGKS